MALKFYNTLTRTKEEFRPIDRSQVRMYTCGPTVYDYAHIGNFRTYMFEDLLRRYLKYKGYDVVQVMNLTDVDDKTIRGSRAEGIPLERYTDRYIEAFFRDLDTLGIERAEVYPRATEHVPEMVAMVKELVERGNAYEIGGNYYYRISSFPGYGKLSNLDLAGLKPGARVATDEYEKDSVSDFALWKAWDTDDGDVFWDTELGRGRPGWHIECSAMSMKYLGNHFDIHTGGVDNKFPHHENEIAQSVAATGEKFVNYWLHSEHLIVEGQRMGKSLGNYYTVPDILEKGHSGLAVRYLLISTHYRQQLNFTFDGLEAAGNALERYNDFIANLADSPGGESDGTAGGVVESAVRGFEEALDDDLNISGALGVVFDLIREINRLKAEGKLSSDERAQVLTTVGKFDTVLNFTSHRIELDNKIEALIRQRTEARESKDFALADKIRDDLLRQGIILEDTPQGVKWKRKI